MQTLLIAAVGLFAWDWPDYRGPGNDGSAPDAQLPTTWSETENVRWKVPVEGRGWSSPVILDGRIWLTTATKTGESLSVLAFDLETGERVVDRVVFEVEEPEHRNALNSYASPSPCVASGRVFVHFGTYGTACLDASSGETVWERRDLRCDHMEGPGSSPFLHDGRLFVHLDGGDVQYLVALDAESGSTLWKRDRSVDYGDLDPEVRKAYSTPVVVRVETEDGEREELISSAARGTYGYDPATGEELWRVRHPGFSMSSRPIVAGGRVIITTGFMRPELWAIRPGLSGDVTKEAFLWRNTRSAPTMPSPILHDGMLVQVSDSGMLSGVDVESGETVWRERLGANVCASLLLVGDELVYAFDRDGKTTIFHATPTFEKVAECALDAGFMASPAVLGDALILRTESHLYRIEDEER
ncbi:MAG: PQQ-binding-like beta-propeller repeat protein [Planctomycetota bacterium]